jgi:hypothetical protein
MYRVFQKSPRKVSVNIFYTIQAIQLSLSIRSLVKPDVKKESERTILNCERSIFHSIYNSSASPSAVGFF